MHFGCLQAHLVFNQPDLLLAATVAVGPRPSQVVRSTALGVLFPELQGYIAPCPRLCETATASPHSRGGAGTLPSPREGDHASPWGELGAHGVESVRVGDSETPARRVAK